MEAKDRIIVALDVNDSVKALKLVNKLFPYVGCFKIGLEFLMSAFRELIGGNYVLAKFNLDILRQLFLEMRGKVFLDGKFHDIPNTVAGASCAASMIGAMGVKFFDVHASSGPKAISEAVKNKGGAKLLAVTLLTSLDYDDLCDIGFASDIEKASNLKDEFVKDIVVKMAFLAKKCGADGVVCSPQELVLLNQYEQLRNLLKVVPGVRSAGVAVNDQKRVMTPIEAIRAGANYLVIGRQITESHYPVGEAKRIAEEIAEAEREAAK